MKCALKWEGLAARMQQKKRLLTRKHVIAWLRFAQRYANWTIHDWKHFILSNETKMGILMVGHGIEL